MMLFRRNKLNRLVGVLAVVSLAFLPTGCAIFQALFGVSSDNFPAAVQEDPKIKPGISLKITVITAGKPDEYPVVVSKAGDITLPFINTVKCDGMTRQELEDRLKKDYTRFFREPQVNVQFLLPLAEGMLSPWGTVTVRGKVLREGPVNIPQTCDLTVTRAMQLAGNATSLGDQNAVRITRTTKDGKKFTKEVDVEAIGKYGKTENDILLQDGDVIWVPEIRW